jgi:hypothetical protein
MSALHRLLFSQEKSQFIREILESHTFGLGKADIDEFDENGEITDPYIVFQPYQISKKLASAIRHTCSDFHISIVKYLENQAFQYNDLVSLGYSPEVSRLICAKSLMCPPDVRFDVVVTQDALDGVVHENSIKIIEVNTPQHGLFWLSTIVNQLICQYFGVECVNTQFASVNSSSLNKYYQSICPQKARNIVLSTPSVFLDNKLDLLTRVSQLSNQDLSIKYKDLDDCEFFGISYEHPGMYFDREKVDILDLRLLPERYTSFHYPLSQDNEKLRPWDFFEELLISNNLIEVNSSLGYAMENKMLFAQLWKDQKDHRFLCDIPYLLPQTVSTDNIDELSCETVWKKPIHGCRGIGVSQTSKNGIILDSACIYQENVEPGKVTLLNETLSVIFSCFVTHDGKATNLVARASKADDFTHEYGELFLPLAYT